MQRDMDLVRRILMELEKASYDLGFVDLEIGGYSAKEIAYHVMLTHQAGLIEAQDCSSFGGLDWRPKRLTWQGHEFLEASRDDSRWERAKDIITKKGGGISFDVLKAILLDLAKRAVFGS